jgi:Zn-dependent M28 family amino/carboxypeptidase
MAVVETANILGLIEGTDPELSDEVVVIGAHVDHLGIDSVSGEIYPGADDNASGTAVMMELARAAAALGAEPARTVLFASWNGEELGLIGSCFFVQESPELIAEMVAVFSIDMVGAGTAGGVDLYGGTESSNAWIGDLMYASSRDRGWRFTVASQPPSDASDHACFAYAGVPAVLVMTRGGHSTYHTPSDTIDTIDAGDLEIAALATWSVLEPLTLGTEGEYLEDEGSPSPRPLWSAPRRPGPLTRRPGQIPRW